MHYDYYLDLFVYINIGDVRIVRFTRLECIRLFTLHTIKKKCFLMVYFALSPKSFRQRFNETTIVHFTAL